MPLFVPTAHCCLELMLCGFFSSFPLFMCFKRYVVEMEKVRRRIARMTIYMKDLQSDSGFLILLRLEDLCVDHVMQEHIMWVKHAGDDFPLLILPLSLISTLKSSSKIDVSKGVILKIDFFWWRVRWSFLCGFCSHLVLRQWCSQELAVNDFRLCNSVFSFSSERKLTLVRVPAFLMNSIVSSKMNITNI